LNGEGEGTDSPVLYCKVSATVPTSPAGVQEEFGRIALTGGIATGKSTVAKIFSDLGATILDADEIAREVVQPGTHCWQKLRRFLGPAYFEENGTLRRRELRQKIIQDRQCRLTVNAILHPSIVQEMDRKWQTLQRLPPGHVVIFDIPLLFEADLADRFDTIILVYASREIQLQRLMQRDGLSPEEAAETLTMQLPIETKRAKSHLLINNSHDLSDTLQQVQAVWRKLRHHGSLYISI
jgi:dephospho-CoA kinase